MSAQNTLACNGAHRLSLLIQQDIQPATLRCIFNAGMVLGSQQPQLSVTSRNVYSSSSTLLFTYLRNKSTRYAGNKKPLKFRGRIIALSPHLADYTAGIGTLPATSQVGCRASSGRFPPPLLMRVHLTGVFSCIVFSGELY